MKNEFSDFLSRGIRGLSCLELLKEDIPEEIENAYKRIKTSGGFWHPILIRKYERYLNQYSEHNQIVQAIYDDLDAVPIDRYYDDPTIPDKGELTRILEITNRAKKFSIPLDNPYLEKIERIRRFVIQNKAIKKQWPYWKVLLQLKEEIGQQSGFLNVDFRERIEKAETKIREQTKAIRNPLYDFDLFPSLRLIMQSHNESYLKRLSADPLFDDINGIALDQQQRMAAVTPEKSALVIAGAGSGKTTTICGRVRYLLERKNVDPNDILLLSYSKKSADDLAGKMKKISSELTVGTFHKIGLDILTDNNGRKFAVEEQWDAIIEAYFRDVLTKDSKAVYNILMFFGLYFNNNDAKHYEHSGEQVREMHNEDFMTLKDMLMNIGGDKSSKRTLKKEVVKSFEELAIANFYYLNGINYEYERPYEKNTASYLRRQYTPDFYLTDYDVYHEHFGIDEEGRAKQYNPKEEQEYLEGVRWKRDLHEAEGTDLIETTSAEFNNETLFDHLTKQLKRRRIKLKPISAEQVSKTMDSIYQGQSFKSFINLVKSFLSLYKSRYEDASAFKTLKESDFPTRFAKRRADLFISICEGVYDYYMRHIRSEGKIDFDDMILQAQRLLPEMAGYRYKYIIVDEFQDISYSRAMFLKALIQHGSSQLFAVGDDWQAIYRFSGCDLNIFLQFDKYFGSSGRYFIGNVHRNSQDLQDIACEFIQKNPEQIRKEIHADKTLSKPIVAIEYLRDEGRALNKAFELIAEKNHEAHILLLGRNNRDIDPIRFLDVIRVDGKGTFHAKNFPDLVLSTSTVHGSKGLEEDVVILVGARDARNGFPNRTEDDPLLNLVMAEPSSYPFAEERRLWYVALTRTRSRTFILTPHDSPSPFLEEMGMHVFVIPAEEGENRPKRVICPRCHTGYLRYRQGPKGAFYGCSNYPNCRYTIDDFSAINNDRRCPVCGDFLVRKKGPHGPFLGCNNYPRCKYIEK